MAEPLHNYRVLIADSDMELANVCRDMLRSMGFAHIKHTSSGAEALRIVQSSPVDFLITDWNIQQMDGLNLIRNIRRSPLSPKPTLPVLMLSGRAEEADVLIGRDLGLNEYVIKPFSAQSIYDRLERIIEQPRRFVVTHQFIGPCRRHRGEPPAGQPDRRRQVLIPKLQPTDTARAITNSSIPKLWLPDFSLKYKLGDATLKSLITDEVLSVAQEGIDATCTRSLQWVKDNIEELKRLEALLAEPNPPARIGADIGEVTLTINARAGTFGYKCAGEIAYILYLFCRNHFQPTRADHAIIVKKFRQVLQVMFGNNLRGDAGRVGAVITEELRKLAAKGAMAP